MSIVSPHAYEPLPIYFNLNFKEPPRQSLRKKKTFLEGLLAARSLQLDSRENTERWHPVKAKRPGEKETRLQQGYIAMKK